jgi:Ni/Co efflux regulator RcnB
MAYGGKRGLALVLALTLTGGMGTALAADEHGHAEGGHPAGHAAPHPAEAHPGPSGYKRVTEPEGWNSRPAAADRGTYQHNFQAARSFHIGPYHPPHGFAARHWGYGDTLPRGYWASQYLVADYWLFALEVPPAGYEWVRVGDDALLVSTVNGEVLQAEYGVFA